MMIGVGVAPYVGAWIETFKKVNGLEIMKSHPTWVRGLKPSLLIVTANPSRSHPTWVRGLKHYEMLKVWYESVAPYVGAWIETSTQR